MAIKKNRLTLIVALIPTIALIALVILLRLQPHKLSDLELNSFEEKTHDIANFLELFDSAMQNTEEIENIDEASSEEETKYEEYAKKASFALQLNYAETGNNELETDKVLEIINNHFSTQLTRDNLNNENLDHYLSKYHVGYHHNDELFSFYNPYSTKKSVINTPITKYLLKSVHRKGDTYYATYERYVIDNPYAALNRTSLDDIQSKYSINDYLDGHGTQLSIKELITADNIIDIAEPNGEIEVIYTVANNNVLFKKIEE